MAETGTVGGNQNGWPRCQRQKNAGLKLDLYDIHRVTMPAIIMIYDDLCIFLCD